MKLCGYDWPHGGRKQVVYVDDQGHVIELWSGFGANGIMRSYYNRQKEDQSETTEDMGVLSSCRLGSRTTKMSVEPEREKQLVERS